MIVLFCSTSSSSPDTKFVANVHPVAPLDEEDELLEEEELDDEELLEDELLELDEELEDELDEPEDLGVHVGGP